MLGDAMVGLMMGAEDCRRPCKGSGDPASYFLFPSPPLLHPGPAPMRPWACGGPAGGQSGVAGGPVARTEQVKAMTGGGGEKAGSRGGPVDGDMGKGDGGGDARVRRRRRMGGRRPDEAASGSPRGDEPEWEGSAFVGAQVEAEEWGGKEKVMFETWNEDEQAAGGGHEAGLQGRLLVVFRGALLA